MDLALLLHLFLLILHFFLPVLMSALPAHLSSGGGGGGGGESHKPQVFLQFSSFCDCPHLFFLHFSLGLSAHASGEGGAAGGDFGDGGFGDGGGSGLGSGIGLGGGDGGLDGCSRLGDGGGSKVGISGDHDHAKFVIVMLCPPPPPTTYLNSRLFTPAASSIAPDSKSVSVCGALVGVVYTLAPSAKSANRPFCPPHPWSIHSMEKVKLARTVGRASRGSGHHDIQESELVKSWASLHVPAFPGTAGGEGGKGGGDGGPAPQLTFTSATAASPRQELPRVYSNANDGE